MKTTLTILTAALGCALASGALAMPMNSPSSGKDLATPTRMVCNENGRCWDQADNPGAAILGGAIRGIEGRSGDSRDREGDRSYRRGWDGDRRGDGDHRGYGSRRRQLEDD
jgi:hypothetical protein